MYRFVFDASMPFKAHGKKIRDEWVTFGVNKLLGKFPNGVDLDEDDRLREFMANRKTSELVTHGCRLFHHAIVLCRYLWSYGCKVQSTHEKVAATSQGWKEHR
jgi:hypothetical protein